MTNMDELTAAIDAAEPGDTVVLAAGEYAPEGGVLTIDKAVNLRGSIPAGGAGYTEFNGAIVYDLAGDARGYRVDVQRIRFNAVEGQSSALTLASGRGWVLAVENCAFNDWLYGVNVLPECRSCKLDVYDSDFNGFCAVSVAAVAGNGVQRLMPGSTGLYEYRKYDSRGNDAYYYDYDAAGGEQAAYDDADYIPEGDITAESPYQAEDRQPLLYLARRGAQGRQKRQHGLCPARRGAERSCHGECEERCDAGCGRGRIYLRKR